MHNIIGLNGASGGTRTPDQLITNQLLYQLSYTGLCKPDFSGAAKARQSVERAQVAGVFERNNVKNADYQLCKTLKTSFILYFSRLFPKSECKDTTITLNSPKRKNIFFWSFCKTDALPS